MPLIIAIALILRLAGINHGFPFIFHPDEPTVVRSALALRFFPNPGHFDWPHLFIYLNYFVYLFFSLFRSLLGQLDLKESLVKLFPLLWNDSLIFYFISRVIAATLGALTVIPIYLMGRDAFGRRVGIIAAITLAITPFHVWHSHYVLIDVPMLFFASWGIYFSLNIVRRKDKNDYVGAGFYTGLASSTKYNAVLSVIAVPLGHIIRVVLNKEQWFDRKSMVNLMLSVVSFFIGFLIGTPYALLDYQTFLRTDGPKGAMWQFTNIGSVPLNQRVPEFFHEIIYKISDDLGYTILIGFFLCGALLLFRTVRKKNHTEDSSLAFIFLMGLFLLIYISGVLHSRSQYYFIAYPYLILSFAYILETMLQQLSLNNAFIGLLIFLLGLGTPLFLSVKNSVTFSRSDTRVALYNWLKTNKSSSDVIYYNKSNLASLADSVGNSHKRISKDETASQPGLIMIAEESDGSVVDFDPRIYGNRIKRIATVDNSLRLGPKIEIFTINK